MGHSLTKMPHRRVSTSSSNALWMLADLTRYLCTRRPLLMSASDPDTREALVLGKYLVRPRSSRLWLVASLAPLLEVFLESGLPRPHLNK